MHSGFFIFSREVQSILFPREAAIPRPVKKLSTNNEKPKFPFLRNRFLRIFAVFFGSYKETVD